MYKNFNVYEDPAKEINQRQKKFENRKRIMKSLPGKQKTSIKMFWKAGRNLKEVN